MKRYIIIGLIMMIMIVTTASAIPNNNIEQKNLLIARPVFAEQCTASWCPNCPMAAEALNNIYESGDYSFYYVSLVNDKNSLAKNRNREYSVGIYKVYAFPTVYFDGGDINVIGRGVNVESTENEYRTIIEQEEQRTPKQPINMESSVTWEGNAKLTVTISLTNEGNMPYFGKLSSYVTEIESRWNDFTGTPYHFAFLDYALNQYIFLMPGKTKTFTGSFDGATDHGGQTYSDITQDNIMVISTVSHWLPHYRLGYESNQYTQYYFAFYVDQTSAAIPN